MSERHCNVDRARDLVVVLVVDHLFLHFGLAVERPGGFKLLLIDGVLIEVPLRPG